MALAETSILRPDRTRHDEPTVSGSLEHLISSSQSIITRRIDLALLEIQVLLKEFVEYAGFYGVAIVLAATTWLAATAAAALLIIPFPNWAMRLGVFAGMNAVGALCCILLARRHSAPVWKKPAGSKPVEQAKVDARQRS